MTALSARDQQDRTMSERAWQSTVEQIAALYGWRCYVPPIPGRRADNTIRNTAAGWPDCAFVKDTRLVFAELKREQGKTTDAQIDWLQALAAVPGVTAYVWRPSDIELVKAVLGRTEAA